MLISSFQIEGNLRRTASKGLISLLNKEQLEWLALKYFGVRDEYGNIIGYQCPYSGKIYTNYNEIVLEHIIPINSNGGTALFNCIPTSSEVNKPNEKGAKHLISWWTNSKYWDIKAPKRLEKLVNYMLEAYDITFNEYSIEEIESSYLEIELNDDIIVDNVEINERDVNKILKKQAKENGIYSYLSLITSCINTLDKCNINTTKLKENLTSLENKHIFQNIERYQLFQNIIEKIIISKIGNDNHNYLTYTLNLNIKKLMDSIEYTKPEDIYDEINLRLTNIENILKSQNLSIIDYFKSLKDLYDIDIIYKITKQLSQQEIDVFLENIKIGIDTKIDIFIDMLNNDNKNILRAGNKESLEGYPNIKLAYFWNHNMYKIKQKLFIELENNPKYDTARKLIDKFLIKNDNDKQILVFINMLNKGNNNILKSDNKETLEGYPDIKLAHFWHNNKNKIKQKLFIELKDNPKYDTARKLIEIHEIKINIDKQIPIFINMLNKGNNKLLKAGNKETLEEYPNVKLAYFWNKYQDRIKQKLFIELKDNPKYDTARKLIEIHEMTINVDKQIPIFIDMLNKGNNNLLKTGNNETLEKYPNIKLSNFWNNNKNQIKQKLFIELKDNPKYDTARKLIERHEIAISVDKQIPIFIDMLNKGNNNILKNGNKETLEGYPNINLSDFYSNYKNKIKQKLFIELKDNPKYDTARKLIKINEITINIDKQIPIFIDMLNQGNSNILKQGNNETLEGYSNIKLAYFWNSHRDRINQKLFIELKDDSRYDTARQTVLSYFKVSTYEEYQEKQAKKRQLKELKQIKKDLENAEQILDSKQIENQRKRA